MREAEAYGPELGGAARAMVVRRLRVLAADEQRKNQMAGEAFRAFALMNNNGARAPAGPADVASRVDARGAREIVVAVAATLGLESALARARRARTTVPAAKETKSTLVVGGYWDTFPQLRR
ncbi:MAG TPA: hypothetical protein VD833_00030 [Vicinamibacterales bacterium]|nr:hypothetical protein [Vicinamibacterales bacterium]